MEPEVVFDVPPELETGTYANTLVVWHSAHEFTLDFFVSGRVAPPDAAGDPGTLPYHLVARLKVAPSLVFELMQVLNADMTEYEQSYGDIKRPNEQ